VPTEQERKAAVRERVWATLENTGTSPGGAHGRIPDFVGSADAAALLATLPAWAGADALMANPDRAQQPVRAHALVDGKLVFMAVPNLAEVKPFYRLDPRSLGPQPERAGDRHVAAQVARTVAPAELPMIGLIVCGSVAVNRHGVRIGKGAGYSDLEVALLVEARRLHPAVTIVTTVHSLQVVPDDLPRSEHDFTVDFIITPDEVIACGRRQQPLGIDWKQVTPEMMRTIPVLSQRPHS